MVILPICSFENWDINSHSRCTEKAHTSSERVWAFGWPISLFSIPIFSKDLYYLYYLHFTYMSSRD